MIRRIPILPTLLVLIAVGVMIRLGFWQLERLHVKEAMLTGVEAAEADTTVRAWRGDLPAPRAYSQISTECSKVTGMAPQSGQNASHQSGWAQVADCVLPSGTRAQVVLGWSSQPLPANWSGGAVTGTYLARGKDGSAIVADPPLAGLQPNATPDPRNIPNNHLAYAVQWFLFAGVALIIYAIALRKRLRAD